MFICQGTGISLFYSYISTYPDRKPKVYVIGQVPNQAWIDNYPQAIKCASVKDAPSTGYHALVGQTI